MKKFTTALCLLLAGCTSQQAQVDSLVEEVWIDINQDRRIDAVDYLSGGGKHYDPYFDARPDDVDRSVILPLMKRLRDDFKAQPWAHVQDDDDYAWCFCVRLPAGGGARSAVARAVREADAGFEGQIDAMWGNRWLVLTFENDEAPEE